MKYIVIKSHVSNYPDPICLEEGGCSENDRKLRWS